MSEYIHRITIIVPKNLMLAANQLALIAGESINDVNTFSIADYIDKDENLYAVCSSIVKPIVLEMLQYSLSSPNAPLHHEGADVSLAQTAMDNSIIYQPGVILNINTIIINIDDNPHDIFRLLELTHVDDRLDPNIPNI